MLELVKIFFIKLFDNNQFNNIEKSKSYNYWHLFVR